jgi:hypothetical protein
LTKNEFQAYETKLYFIRSKLTTGGRKLGAFPEPNNSAISAGAAEEGKILFIIFK